MDIVRAATELRTAVAALRKNAHRIAFVPTMGNLHAGHAALMTQARAQADAVVASIYVNPLQFGPREDFAAYPRTPEADAALLKTAGVDVLFMPDEATIYPRGRAAHTRVEVPAVGDILCGAARPGHFAGVTTVVARLFNLVQPDVALFGNKDFQQLLLIRLMTADLGMPIEIIGCDTVRAEDGLALSSRNGYLTPAERAIAPQLYAALQLVAQQMRTGETAARATERAGAQLAQAGFAPEYVSVRRATDLAEPGSDERALVVLAAGRLGRARLIDNLEFDLNLKT